MIVELVNEAVALAISRRRTQVISIKYIWAVVPVQTARLVEPRFMPAEPQGAQVVRCPRVIDEY